jgi:hypothetical protein
MGKRWTNRLAVRRRGLAVRNWRIVMSAVTGLVAWTALTGQVPQQ